MTKKTTHKPKKDLTTRLKAFWQSVKRDPKKQALYGGIAFAVCVILVLGVLVLAQGGEEGSIIDVAKDVVSADDAPTEEPRHVDGIIVPIEEANPVLACVMIENAAFGGVRPQSGLSQASIVYEIIVEGGITRYMAVFADKNAESAVGPVRSARDTYLEFASELDCAYTHAGGSFTAMVAMPRFGLKHIDALLEAQYFERVAGKFAPHNLYTSIEQLFTAIEDHSWAGEENEPQYETWTFEDEPTNEAAESVESVVIRFGGSYDSEFKYNEEENAYERYNGGELQSDAETGEPLLFKNVVIEHVGEGTPLPDKGRINWPVTGEGDVEVYRSGERVRGTWVKQDRLARTTYVDKNGEPIEFERGASWVSVVPPHIEVEETIPEDTSAVDATTDEEQIEEGEFSTSPDF